MTPPQGWQRHNFRWSVHRPESVNAARPGRTYLQKRQSEGFALRSLPSDQERFGVGSAAADLERAEILRPITVGNFRARLDPQAKLIEIRDADRAITHPLDQMLPYPFGQPVPAFELRH